MKVENRLILNAVDLDHIIDVDLFIENKNIPPSLTFLEILIHEADMNGIDLNEIDIIEIDLNQY